ncbi:hypothetical protein ACFL56_02355 [Candidatus Margulisiibacteriota bacterium]
MEETIQNIMNFINENKETVDKTYNFISEHKETISSIVKWYKENKKEFDEIATITSERDLSAIPEIMEKYENTLAGISLILEEKGEDINTITDYTNQNKKEIGILAKYIKDNKDDLKKVIKETKASDEEEEKAIKKIALLTKSMMALMKFTGEAKKIMEFINSTESSLNDLNTVIEDNKDDIVSILDSLENQVSGAINENNEIMIDKITAPQLHEFLKTLSNGADTLAKSTYDRQIEVLKTELKGE